MIAIRAAAVAALLAATITVPAAATAGPVACRDVTIPVALVDGGPTTQHIAGTLCSPPGASVVEVLVHGMTYDRTYWDLPGNGGANSYVRSATSAGHATLAVDRIGIGASSHPFGLTTTIDTNATTIHQVITAARGYGYPTVVLTGHSYGSWTAWYEASRYHDVDAVILSGVSHAINVGGPLAVLPRLLDPAPLDPALHNRPADLTYLTSLPGQRDAMFHAPDHVDPALVAFDEAHKTTVTVGEIANFPLILAHPLDIRVPVLLANSTVDPLFCGGGGADCTSAAGLVAFERPHLGPRVPSVDGFVLPGAGHDLNYSPHAAVWFAAAQQWIGREVGA